jgi:HEAT repeat protein
MLQDPDPELAQRVHQVLMGAHDVAVAADLAAACRPRGDPFDPLAKQSYCLVQLARLRPAAELVGPAMLTFVSSPNGMEAAIAIDGLGELAYAPAGPALVTAMRSSDWRVVYAAATSLGQLGPEAPGEAVPALRQIAEGHWLPEVRERAREAADALAAGRRLPPANYDRSSAVLPIRCARRWSAQRAS